MALTVINEIEYTTYKLDDNMKIIDIDENFSKMTGYTLKDIKENDIYQADLIFEEDRERYFDMVQKNLAKSGEAFIEHRIKCKNGSEKFVFCLGHGFLDEDGNPISIIRSMDVTNLVSMRIQADRIRKENDDELEEWIKIANTDELTGVLRRGAFLPTINELVKEGIDYTLLMIDVDDFKNVNDICGHKVGDDVLRALADVFKRVVREKDLICRMGGDDFFIFLQNAGTLSIAENIAKRIISEVDKLQYITEEKAPVHVSIGGMIHNNSSGFDLKKMFIEADEALYSAKEQGKNRCVIR